MKKLLLLSLASACLFSLRSGFAEKNVSHPVRKPLPPQSIVDKLPPDGGTEFNRLIHETSPYLRQHARNPVDWYPWAPEAFERARKENKPIFLSVGYSSCHWCHVMEHESFEDDEVAAILNEHFISVKVDREERPDVDQIYMNATQIVTGRGGWPNSVFMDADQRPFFCGTYFPKEGKNGGPGFISLLHNIHEVWTKQPERVSQSATQISDALKQLSYAELKPSTKELDRSLVDTLIAALRQDFDLNRGGFGGAPKFPPHQSLALLLYEYEQNGDEAVMDMVNLTLLEMAKGGIYDHVGGGFHRYATDNIWFLPHFEKMLYDNAQLSRVYAQAYKLTGNAYYKHVVEGINRWVLREMLDEEGGFFSAFDADSEGEEGKFYLWSLKEVQDILGAEAPAFAATYDISEAGNYYEEATRERKPVNIPHLSNPLTELENQTSLIASLEKLRVERAKRIWPMLDDKVIVSWNGLMIGALAYSGQVLESTEYINAAKKAANFILRDMKRADGRLYATYRKGRSKLNAYLDDYVFLAHGLLDLHVACGDKKYLDEAIRLMDTLQQHFHDPKGGGFFFTANDHENLLSRNKDPFDGAIPSGNGIASQVFVRLAELTDDDTYRTLAKKNFSTFEPLISQSPRGSTSFVQAIAQFHDTEDTPVVTSTPDAKERHAPVTVSAYLSALRVPPGGTISAAVQLAIDEKWHVYGNQLKNENYIPTRIVLEKNDRFAIAKTSYPTPNQLNSELLEETTPIYEGSPIFRSALVAKSDAEPGPTEIVFAIRFQACDDMICKQPVDIKLKIPVSIDPEAKRDRRHVELFK